MFSGVRAEFNQELFLNLATQVIVQGIDTKRTMLYEQMVEHGQSKSIKDYNVQAAVKDAVYYHGQCSVIVGFQEAADAIKLVEDPGLNAATRTLLRVNVMRNILDNRSTDAREAGLVPGPGGEFLLAGTFLDQSKLGNLPVNQLIKARTDIDQALNQFKISLEAMDKYDQTIAKPLTTEADILVKNSKGLLNKCKPKAEQANLEFFKNSDLATTASSDSARRVATNERDESKQKAFLVSGSIRKISTALINGLEMVTVSLNSAKSFTTISVNAAIKKLKAVKIPDACK